MSSSWTMNIWIFFPLFLRLNFNVIFLVWRIRYCQALCCVELFSSHCSVISLFADFLFYSCSKYRTFFTERFYAGILCGKAFICFIKFHLHVDFHFTDIDPKFYFDEIDKDRVKEDLFGRKTPSILGVRKQFCAEKLH